MLDIPGWIAEKNALYGEQFTLLFELQYTDAVLTTALAGSNNDLTFTARTPITQTVRVVYVVSGNNTPLSVAVAGGDITVNVATNGGGAATSTASLVMAALQASAAAAALTDVNLASGNDGSGVVTAMAITALTGDQYVRWARIEKGSVTFESKTWNAFGYGIPTRSQNARGEFPTFDIPVANPGRTLQALLEQNIIEGRNGRLITVHRLHLADPTANNQEQFTVIDAKTRAQLATLTCAGIRFNWLRTPIPRKLITRAEFPGIQGSRSRYL
jgi:hypothetical protein